MRRTISATLPNNCIEIVYFYLKTEREIVNWRIARWQEKLKAEINPLVQTSCLIKTRFDLGRLNQGTGNHFLW